MDIQNCSTPPKRVRFQTPTKNSSNNPYQTPPRSSNNKQNYDTPKKDTFQTPKQANRSKNIDSSSKRPLCKKTNPSLCSSAKPKQNPQSKNRNHQPLQQCEREEFQITAFTLSRLETDYMLVHMLGRGNFSQVGLYQSRLSKEFVAIKETKANRMSINEVQALGSLWVLVEHSPNVVRYYHSWVEDGLLYVVMEYCEDSLSRMIQRQRQSGRPFDEKVVKKFMKSALLGLECLHKCGILHLDLKPDNLLLQGQTIKIADFGLSRAAKVRSGDIQQGDSRYLAKQVLNFSPQIDLTKADIFSLAMTLYEMITLQRLPNNGPQWMRIRQEGISITQRMDLTDYSSDLLHLIQKMGHNNWLHRPSASQILHSPYLKQSHRTTNFFASHTRSSTKKRDSSL